MWCGCGGMGSCSLTISLPSHHFKFNLLTQTIFFFQWPLFLLSFLPALGPVCVFFFLGLPVFPLLLSHPIQQERGKASPVTLFFSLFSFQSSSPPPTPPLFLSASLNSPSLIQLPGRRDSACSDCFTPHGPPSLSGSPLLR